MAKSTFSGPVKSLAGFISAGVNNSVSLTADTTLTVDAHAGKILLCNDADGKFTLPSIVQQHQAILQTLIKPIMLELLLHFL
jgi:hypothetical protein